MAGNLVSNYSQLDSNILEVQLTLDQSRKGKHQISLTNYDTTDVPAIAAGSVIEVNGALYKFSSEEVILDTEGISDGTVYVYIIPGLTTCTAEYTNTAPTWSDSKQGWYGTGANATYRYIDYKIYLLSGVYKKRQLINDQKRESIYYEISDATERTKNTGAFENEPNLTITINVIEGRTYSFILVYESSTDSTGGHIVNGDATWYSSATSKFLNYASTTSASARPDVSQTVAGFSALCCINSEYIARATESYTYYMAWSATLGTLTVKNRRLIIQEITDKRI